VYGQRWPTLRTLGETPAYNVGRAYAAFADNLQYGTQTVPDFAQALTRHKMIAAIDAAATSRRDQVSPPLGDREVADG
jgi:hypothetical protein